MLNIKNIMLRPHIKKNQADGLHRKYRCINYQKKPLTDNRQELQASKKVEWKVIPGLRVIYIKDDNGNKAHLRKTKSFSSFPWRYTESFFYPFPCGNSKIFMITGNFGYYSPSFPSYSPTRD